MMIKFYGSTPISTVSHLLLQVKAMKHLDFESKSLPLMLSLIVILLFQTLATTRAQDSTFVSLLNCPDESPNFTTGSQFQSNLLNLLFPALVSNGAISGFFNTSSGFDTDTIYGLVQCRGDVSTEDCKTCLNYATVVIAQRCPNKADATIRFANCMLRYSNIRFFSQMDSQITERWVWNVDVSDDVLLFNQQLGLLMNNLTSLASSKPSKFEQGWIQYTAINKIYGLVQCTEDISSDDCSSCLQARFSQLPSCCGGKNGGWVVSRSCQIWYRQDLQFFRLLSPPTASSLPQPPPSPLPQLPTSENQQYQMPQVPSVTRIIGPPSPTTPASDATPVSDAGGSSQGVIVIVGPTVAVLIVVLLIVICVRKRRGQTGQFINI